MAQKHLTLDDICEEYPLIPRSTLYRAIEAGDLTALKVGRAYLIERAWLNTWLNRNTRNPEAARAGGEA